MAWMRTALLAAALVALLAPLAAQAQIVPKACSRVHSYDYVREKGALSVQCKGDPVANCNSRCKTAIQRVGGQEGSRSSGGLVCACVAFALWQRACLRINTHSRWVSHLLLQLGYECTSYLRYPGWV